MTRQAYDDDAGEVLDGQILVKPESTLSNGQCWTVSLPVQHRLCHILLDVLSCDLSSRYSHDILHHTPIGASEDKDMQASIYTSRASCRLSLNIMFLLRLHLSLPNGPSGSCCPQGSQLHSSPLRWCRTVSPVKFTHLRNLCSVCFSRPLWRSRESQSRIASSLSSLERNISHVLPPACGCDSLLFLPFRTAGGTAVSCS